MLNPNRHSAMKRITLLPILLLLLLPAFGQSEGSFFMGMRYDRPQAPMSNLGYESGLGMSYGFLAPSLLNQTPRQLFAIQPGGYFDFNWMGSNPEDIVLLDPWGVERAVPIKNTMATGGGLIRFSLAEHFPVRPYLDAEIGLRTMRTYENWVGAYDYNECPKDEPENITLERSWTPVLGMGAGLMFTVGRYYHLDIKATWRQQASALFVAPESIQQTEKGSLDYSYRTERSAGQFLGIQVSLHMPLTDCHEGCNHSSCCAPSRHQLEQGFSPAQP